LKLGSGVRPSAEEEPDRISLLIGQVHDIMRSIMTWPSGKMSHCNVRGREFKSRSEQNKFAKVMGSDGKL